MKMTRNQSGALVSYHKVIAGSAHPTFADNIRRATRVPLGIAFRTQDCPLGYLPFFSSNDFDLNGQVSFKEEVLARLPINFSAIASPHTLLIQEAAEDPEFAGSGDSELADIGPLVRRDRLRLAMTAASSVMVDSLMVAFGGPAVKAIVGQFVGSRLKQFVISKAISAAAKKQLKEAAGVDLDHLLLPQR
jgi:hypothetical protein